MFNTETGNWLTLEQHNMHCIMITFDNIRYACSYAH